jgi:outer membrane receptor protein involved in Fe transport
MLQGDTAVTTRIFTNTSFRIGVNYGITKNISVFAGWSQGFIPPSTEELASNPTGYSGFNTHLVSATSDCIDLGFRGFVGSKINYELSGFMMNTENDFFRFKQSGRGNQEVFYGNAGNSKRTGIETSFGIELIKNLNLMAAYTFSVFQYTSASVDPVYTDTAYVLTTPPVKGQYLPNSPKHQLYAELEYTFHNISFSIGAEHQSKWAIYTDSKAYHGELDPTVYQNWQDGFTLLNARISYNWKLGKIHGDCSLAARNITAQKYMAFTEPDPDGNSYQPGPSRELFGSLRIKF